MLRSSLFSILNLELGTFSLFRTICTNNLKELMKLIYELAKCSNCVTFSYSNL